MIAILEIITRYILIWIDRALYSFIPSVYNLLMDIAETTIFSEDIISAFSSRIYGLLGIFMLFKVSFSILNYIVNPDDFTDKNKGFSKIISNILITLVLLVVTPWIFSEAMNLQRILLRDNIVGKLILGSSGSSNIENAGQTMAFETFKAFYYPNDTVFPECSDYNEGIEITTSADKCVNSWGDVDDKNAVSEVLKTAAQTKSVNVYLDHDLATMKSGDDYVMNYIPIISTIAGGFIIAILISFCFDVAIRSIKLGFYQMLSPIPIISRLDPKKGKETFNKWVKACLSTFADLFIRLAGIYFSIFIISEILGNDSIQNTVTGGATKVSILVKAFIVMGALLFAKELPKAIEELFGVKLSGKFEWNPLKRAASVPLAGSLAAGALGGVGAMAAHQGFKTGFKSGFKSIPITGGDGKKTIFGGMTRFTDNGKKMTEERKQHDLGEKLYNNFKENEYGFYEGANASNYAESVKRMNSAKDRRNTMESDYEKLKMRRESGDNSITVDAVDKARIASVKASSDYDKLKSAHEFTKKQDPRNAVLEDAFYKSKDSHDASDKVAEFNRINAGQPVNGAPIQSTQSNTSGRPSGRGDPVPGQPNPNTSRDKQQRRNQ